MRRKIDLKLKTEETEDELTMSVQISHTVDAFYYPVLHFDE